VADRAQFSLTDADALLELIYSKATGRIVVVAGQAVNFWADRYVGEDSRFLALRPFTSRDLDLFGEIANAYRLASETHAPVEKPRRGSASPVLANVSVTTGRLIRAVQFLRSVRGVTNQEIIDNAIPFERGRVKFYVADPVTMLKAKLHNVADLNQRGRSDKRHVKILMLCVPLFLTKQLLSADETDTAARQCLRNMQRIIALSRAPVVQRLKTAKRFNWSRLLPITRLERVKNARLKNFRDYQLKRWLAEP
jgi:hypothetical protein